MKRRHLWGKDDWRIVHGGVEARVQPDKQDDGQVLLCHGQVHDQDQGKVHALLLWLDGKSQEEQLVHTDLFLPPHVPLMSAEEGGEWVMSETLNSWLWPPYYASSLLMEKKNNWLHFFYHLVLPRQVTYPQHSPWFLSMKTRKFIFFSLQSTLFLALSF